MTHSLAAARRWSDDGTELFLDAVGDLAGPELEAASGLPGWTRAHVAAHVAANADALGNLVHWAATGEETPMYASTGARDAQIEAGTRLDGTELVAWLRRSADELARASDALTEGEWRTAVRTAQGRTVPATETAWMRARELLVHAVDLAVGTTFADLPEDFLHALVEDIRSKRDLDAAELPAGPLPELAAWLAGRPHALTAAPDLGPWL